MEKKDRIHVPKSAIESIKSLEYKKSPLVVARSTYIVLSIFSNEADPDFTLGKYALFTETLPYLEKAKNGCGDSFNLNGNDPTIEDPLLLEASSHALVTLGSIPDFLTERSKKYSFSKKGMFRPPETKEEYLERIDEIKKEIVKILCNQTFPDDTNKLNFPLMRAYIFFKVGGQLPIKVTEEDKIGLERLEALKKEMGFIDRITEGIDFSVLD